MEFLIFMLVVIALIGMSSSNSEKKGKGTFKVTAYKNGEVVYVETYVNRNFTVRPTEPGKGKFDRIEIEG